MVSGLIPLVVVLPLDAGAREELPTTESSSADTVEDGEPQVPETIEVDPIAEDTDIDDRLTRILAATEWFEQPHVIVDEGVVFLSGRTKDEKYREWAGKLAGNTQDVVAVVNRIEVLNPSIWNLSPTWQRLRGLANELIQVVPLLVVGLFLLALFWLLARWAFRVAEVVLRTRMQNAIMRHLAVRLVAIPVFLLGLYIVLRVSGLTRLAVTLIGGTGLLGLIVGIAFRDIAQNFLASLLISFQRPFQAGHFIEVEGNRGFVQRVTTRGTLLMTLEGNHVHIPNSIIYKSIVYNYSVNPNTRFEISVGIDYGERISEAQQVALDTLQSHPAVLADPEPSVLVEELGTSAVDLRMYFWVDCHEHSGVRVRSAVMRHIKRAFEEHGFAMPDEAREVIFPHPMPVQVLRESEPLPHPSRATVPEQEKTLNEQATATGAEGDLESEAKSIQAQADRSPMADAGSDLLQGRAENEPVTQE